MMLQDNVLDLLRNMFFLGQQRTIHRMACNDCSGNIRIRPFMRIVAGLVFLEISGPLQFSDIMVIGAGPRKIRIGLDFVSSRFRMLVTFDLS